VYEKGGRWIVIFEGSHVLVDRLWLNVYAREHVVLVGVACVVATRDHVPGGGTGEGPA